MKMKRYILVTETTICILISSHFLWLTIYFTVTKDTHTHTRNKSIVDVINGVECVRGEGGGITHHNNFSISGEIRHHWTLATIKNIDTTDVMRSIPPYFLIFCTNNTTKRYFKSKYPPKLDSPFVCSCFLFLLKLSTNIRLQRNRCKHILIDHCPTF